MMKDNEHILDSGEIYKDFEPLELPLGDGETHEIDWSSRIEDTKLQSGGSSYKTHHLITLNKEVLWLVPIVSTIAACFLFFFGVFLFGLGAAGCISLFSNWEWIAIPISLFFLAMGGFLFYSGIKINSEFSINFLHKEIGLFWSRNKESIQIDDIKGVQILKKYVRDSRGNSFTVGDLLTRNGKFYSYEINFILKDESRINVIDHGKENAAIRQAMRLAQFLDVPLLKWKQ